MNKIYPFKAKPIPLEEGHWIDTFENEEEYIKSFIPDINFKDGYVYGYLLDDWIVGDLIDEDDGCFCPEFWIEIQPETVQLNDVLNASKKQDLINLLVKYYEEQKEAEKLENYATAHWVSHVSDVLIKLLDKWFGKAGVTEASKTLKKFQKKYY